MSDYDSWLNACPHCDVDLRYVVDGKQYSRLEHVVDPMKDCIVAYRCPDCGTKWARSLGEIIAAQDTTGAPE